ncbi:coiled-coil domain-containing protein 18-like [Lineus longissimus]|uniref:coiled-coil domain-containing protein 18-like n=1 Tax=Lineus longissimus TaxID=88925 RepID=UPI002B4FB53C
MTEHGLASKLTRSKEDLLIRNVHDLRKRLQETERSLQSLSCIDDDDEQPVLTSTFQSNVGTPRTKVPPLTLDVSPDDGTESYHPLSQVSASTASLGLGASFSNFERRMFPQYSTPREKRSMCSQPSLSASSIEQDNETLRRKLQTLREENANMVTQNHKLQNEAENMEYELGRANTQINFLKEELDKKSQDAKKVLELQEKLMNLESEVEVQDNALRDAEDRCDSSHRTLDESRREIEMLCDDVGRLKNELAEEVDRRNRIEVEKNAALAGIDELQASFHEYQRKVKDRLRKHQSNEEHLRETFEKVKQERNDLTIKVASQEAQLNDLKEEIKRFQDETNRDQEKKDDLEELTGDLQAQVKSQAQKIGKLQNHLLDFNALQSENKELVAKINHQKQQLDECQQEVEQSRKQLARLEKWVKQITSEKAERMTPRLSTRSNDSGIHDRRGGSRPMSPAHPYNSFSSSEGSPDSARATVSDLRMKLAMKEAEVQNLQARLASVGFDDKNQSMLETIRGELNAYAEKNKSGELDTIELKRTITDMEKERTSLKGKIACLEARVSELDSNSSDLSFKLKHRNSDVSEMQRDLSAKNTEVLTLERELRRKTNQMASMERQLDEKVQDYTEHVKKLDAVEDELNKKTGQLNSIKGQMDERKREVIEAKAMASKMKQIHVEQCQEYEKQIEIFQKKLEERTDQLKEAESIMRSIRDEMDFKESHVQQLKDQLGQAKVHVETKSQADNETLKGLEERASEATGQVEKLESALVVCKEELQMVIEQLEETKERYDREMTAKSEEAADLEDQLHQYHSELKKRGLHIADLEKTLQERQEMLQQSAHRIGELEDGQSQMENQVCKLEQQLTKAENKSMIEIQTTEHKLRQACLDIEERGEQIKELMRVIKNLQSEKLQLSTNLDDMKHELSKEKTDLDNKEAKIMELETELREFKQERDKKAATVTDSEEQVHKLEADYEVQLQMNKDLDAELKKTQLEITQTVRQLTELQQLLTLSQTDLKNKELEISGLQDIVRINEAELTNRTTELDDLDQVLKERQWELEQRAAQVSQLDMTIREHRSDMEQQVMRLETLLAKRQSELEQRSNEFEELAKKVEGLHENLVETQHLLQTANNTANRLQIEIEGKNSRISELEKQLQKAKDSYDELRSGNLELNQELRITREQMQRQHMEVTETRKEMSQCQREQERFAREVDEAIAMAQTKEADANRLAEELGAGRAREAQLESRTAAEVRRLKHEIDLLREQHAKEINNLREDHAKIVSSKDELAAQHRLHVKDLKENMQCLTGQLESARDHVLQLERELDGRRDAVDAANESMVLKEAEIVRLEAKISGYQRAANMQSQTIYNMGRDSTRSGNERFPGGMRRSTSDYSIKLLTEESETEVVTMPFRHIPFERSPRSRNVEFMDSQQPGRSRIPVPDLSPRNPHSTGPSPNPPRSNISGVFSASESDTDLDSFQGMLRHVNKMCPPPPMFPSGSLNNFQNIPQPINGNGYLSCPTNGHQSSSQQAVLRRNRHGNEPRGQKSNGDVQNTHPDLEINNNNTKIQKIPDSEDSTETDSLLTSPATSEIANTTNSFTPRQLFDTESGTDTTLDNTTTTSEGTPTLTATTDEERTPTKDSEYYDDSEASFSTASTVETQIQYHR